MLRKDEILERTNNGLNVFKHYISGTWRVGRNFLNPLYEDNKASCNIYFDRRSGTYKMKDFGNDNYSGDCFFFVGSLKGLDCNNSGDFIEILQIIDRDLSLGISEGNPMPVPQPFKELEKPVPVPVERTGRPYTFKERKLTASELEYWQPYDITPEILEQYKVCSVVQFQSENAEGNPFSYSSSKEEPTVQTVFQDPLPVWRKYRRELLLRTGTTTQQRRYPVYYGWGKRCHVAGSTWFPRDLL